MTRIDSKLQLLIDRQDISDVMVAYCRAIDRLDGDLFREVFWEDGGYQCGNGGYISAGAKDFQERILIQMMQRAFVSTQHFLSNARFDFESSTVAHTEVYFCAFHRTHATRESLEASVGALAIKEHQLNTKKEHDAFAGGRYLDTFEKRGGIWRIVKRRLAPTWTSAVPASDWGVDGAMAAFGWPSTRDGNDPSYRR